MLKPERTEYASGSARVFHVASVTGVYNELCQKYGGDNCFLGTNQKPIVDALSQTMSGRGDRVLIYPGTYTTSGTGTDGTAITISKANVTIESATGNAADVNIVAEDDCELFSVAATADGTQFKNLTITPDASATTPQDGIEVIAGCVGVVIDGCVFVGSDKITVAIDSEGDRLTVKNCRFEDIKFPIQSNGNYPVITHNFFVSDNSAAIGVDLGAGNWGDIAWNTFSFTDAGAVCIKGAASSCLLGAVHDNRIHVTPTKAILLLTGCTYASYANVVSDATAAIAYAPVDAS